MPHKPILICVDFDPASRRLTVEFGTTAKKTQQPCASATEAVDLIWREINRFYAGELQPAEGENLRVGGLVMGIKSSQMHLGDGTYRVIGADNELYQVKRNPAQDAGSMRSWEAIL